MSRLTSDSAHRAIKSELLRSIREKGAISYAEFMEQVLYSVPHGYYAAGRNYESDGDYLTSAMLHPAFGAVIALQLREMWVHLGCPPQFDLIELGGGRGDLSRAITEFTARSLPDFDAHLRVRCFDIAQPSDSSVYSMDSLAECRGLTGCILSNELLDALPVRSFSIKDGALYENLIGEADGELREVVSKEPAQDLPEAAATLAQTVPSARVWEYSPQLAPLARQMAEILSRGYVITIDYGYEQSSDFGGTLHSYYRHTETASVLDNLGLQDITAGVDFTAFERAMQPFFHLQGWAAQSDFLQRFGIADWIADFRASSLPQRAKLANIGALLRLVDEDGLGSLRVYVHRRGAAAQPLTGLGQKKFRGTYAAPDIMASEVKYRNLIDAWPRDTGYNIERGSYVAKDTFLG